MPAWILAGSDGALQIQIRCLTQSQYLGMAESDLYLLSSSGNFGFNYMKGLFGVWLQAMVLTAIGVFAGTFLSWPVALLTTIFFFVAGQLAFAFLVDFSRQAIMGGGPFESLIRIISHDNQMSELTPTAAVVLAKTLDSLAMPVMSMLVYLVPNFQALDVSNMVADGFMVSWRMMHLQRVAGIGLCPAVLLRRISHPEEPGSRSMNALSNFNRKLIYGMIIVALFGVMFPYTNWLGRGKEKARPGRGRHRPDRHRQLHDEAVPPGRLPRDRRRHPLAPRRRAEERSRLGPARNAPSS